MLPPVRGMKWDGTERSDGRLPFKVCHCLSLNLWIFGNGLTLRGQVDMTMVAISH